MRLICFSCGKSVTNELPNDTILRAIATCPECLLKNTDDALQQQVAELQENLSAWIEQHEKDIVLMDVRKTNEYNAQFEIEKLKEQVKAADEDAERLYQGGLFGKLEWLLAVELHRDRIARKEGK